MGVSIHEHKVLITLVACVCIFDQAEALGSDFVVDEVVVFAVVFVVVVEGAERLLTSVVQDTGYAAVQKACAIGYCLRIGLSSP